MAWKVAIRRENYVPGKYSFVCSDHFTAEDYKGSETRKCLKPDSVPSIFTLPHHLLQKSKRERPFSERRMKRKLEEEREQESNKRLKTITEQSVLLDHSYTYTSIEEYRNAMIFYRSKVQQLSNKLAAANMKISRVS